MADPSAHTNQPSASTTRLLASSSLRPASISSDEASRSNKSSSRHPPSDAARPTTPSASSPRDASAMQRSVSPSEVTKYTKTGRISKAKKGLKVHLCESCGKSYTRAEHLRRHQQNHSGAPLQCDWPDCGKSFHRVDLLDRHKERHTDPNNDDRRSSVASQTSSSAPYGSYQSAPIAPMTPREVATTMSESTASYEVPVTAGHLMDPTPASTSSSGKPFSNASTFSRGPVTISGGDVTYTGSLFGDYRWSPPPEPVSCAGDYPSPGQLSYPEISYVPNPYPAFRPRTLSNASLYDPWTQSVPRSPPSPTSTQPFYWLDVERDPAMQSVSFCGSSGIASYATSDTSIYPASTEHGPHFMAATTPPFRSFEELDAQEHCLLFPDQLLGIPVIDPIQSHRYLDHFWQFFHPHFPIKHKPTFVAQSQPPLLLAAMLAVGAQYSQEAGSKAESRALHGKCLKAIAKREHDHVHSSRSEDMQAIFLVELISQFRGQRASKSLSAAFRNLYHSLCRDADARATNIDDIANSSVSRDSSEYNIWQQWQHWIVRSSKSRLLGACFVLDAQQNVLLARTESETFISGLDLTRPAPVQLWDAVDFWQWAEKLPAAISSDFDTPTTIKPTTKLDGFQTMQSLYANESSNRASAKLVPALAQPIDALDTCRRDSSSATQVIQHAIGLTSSTPLRALLAITGETWILSNPVPKDVFETSKRELRDWVDSLFTPSTSSAATSPRSIGISLANALSMLSLATDGNISAADLPIGAEMAVYYAALVLWAVVQGASARHSPDPIIPAEPFASLALTSTSPSTPDAFKAAQAFVATATTELSLVGAGAEAYVDTERLARMWRGDADAVNRWQDGVAALLVAISAFLTAGETGTETGRGELVGSAARALERVGRRGWVGGWF
ncbi:hypothetical protein K490DRAFT_65575 [Saccharata proteae CBS 121410]|uniref:C2H2-type domain-containing protein n=1 Tax=Saccharata proteae CBS 121410 TaxID=1314787 RepID=A0A9P4LVQ4_9PEZI|nr:hypothetical protein K490DRAFT_65575 [Saccharata proteae CBS 121410]